MSNRKSITVIRVSENFTIRKLDPKEITRKYFNGDYSNRKLPASKIKKKVDSVKMGKEIGQKECSEVFQFKDRNNNYQTIFTTNHNLYQKEEENTIVKCKYCKRKILKNHLGLPIRVEKKGEELIFHILDSFCDFGCAFSFLKRKNFESRLFKSSSYINSEQLLYFFFYSVFPEKEGEKIREKPDWDLLRENGGPLTDEEFDSGSIQFIPTPNVILSPSKKQYIKINSKN